MDIVPNWKYSSDFWDLVCVCRKKEVLSNICLCFKSNNIVDVISQTIGGRAYPVRHYPIAIRLRTREGCAILCVALIPQSGDSSGTTLGVRSVALLHAKCSPYSSVARTFFEKYGFAFWIYSSTYSYVSELPTSSRWTYSIDKSIFWK